jgi:hypothetical protein
MGQYCIDQRDSKTTYCGNRPSVSSLSYKQIARRGDWFYRQTNERGFVYFLPLDYWCKSCMNLYIREMLLKSSP